MGVSSSSSELLAMGVDLPLPDVRDCLSVNPHIVLSVYQTCLFSPVGTGIFFTTSVVIINDSSHSQCHPSSSQCLCVTNSAHNSLSRLYCLYPFSRSSSIRIIPGITLSIAFCSIHLLHHICPNALCCP